MKTLFLLIAILLTACGPSIQEEEQVDEIDQLVVAEKARAELLIKTDTIKAMTNPLQP